MINWSFRMYRDPLKWDFTVQCTAQELVEEGVSLGSSIAQNRNSWTRKEGEGRRKRRLCRCKILPLPSNLCSNTAKSPFNWSILKTTYYKYASLSCVTISRWLPLNRDFTVHLIPFACVCVFAAWVFVSKISIDNNKPCCVRCGWRKERIEIRKLRINAQPKRRSFCFLKRQQKRGVSIENRLSGWEGRLFIAFNFLHTHSKPPVVTL